MTAGPWARSDRRSRLPRNWRSLREQVRLRAGGRCEHVDGDGRCLARGVDCDHIVNGDNHSLGNLQWLCRPHHTAKTQREANAAIPSARRAPGRHPGLL